MYRLGVQCSSVCPPICLCPIEQHQRRASGLLLSTLGPTYQLSIELISTAGDHGTSLIRKRGNVMLRAEGRLSSTQDLFIACFEELCI